MFFSLFENIFYSFGISLGKLSITHYSNIDHNSDTQGDDAGESSYQRIAMLIWD